MLAASRAAAERSSIEDITVKPEIKTNSDAQDEVDFQNVRVKEGIAERITNIVGRDIMNPNLWITDNRYFKSVNQYQIHQFFNSITEGAEQPELSTIRR